jgi:hypothetical protein
MPSDISQTVLVGVVIGCTCITNVCESLVQIPHALSVVVIVVNLAFIAVQFAFAHASHLQVVFIQVNT